MLKPELHSLSVWSLCGSSDSPTSVSQHIVSLSTALTCSELIIMTILSQDNIDSAVSMT